VNAHDHLERALEHRKSAKSATRSARAAYRAAKKHRRAVRRQHGKNHEEYADAEYRLQLARHALTWAASVQSLSRLGARDAAADAYREAQGQRRAPRVAEAPAADGLR
jgi:phage shock protein A